MVLQVSVADCGCNASRLPQEMQVGRAHTEMRDQARQAKIQQSRPGSSRYALCFAKFTLFPKLSLQCQR
jgi:hypothetical protein